MTELTEAEIERLALGLAQVGLGTRTWQEWGELLAPTVADLIDARLAPIRALAEEWDAVDLDDPEAVRGLELMCHRCGCTRWWCLNYADAMCCGDCDHTPEETR